jgi:hypothetical protein
MLLIKESSNENMRLSTLPNRAKFVVIYYLFIVAYWIITFILGLKFSQANYYYQFFFGLIPLLGGVGGLINAQKWGGLKSGLGRAVFFLSLGLVTWGLGQMVWSYYVIFEHAEVPYPSFADLGYVISWPLWSIGMINLSKATGARFGLRRNWAKVLTVVLPLVILALTYYLLIIVARDGALFPEIDTSLVFIKTVLDVGYPLGDVVILTLALLVFGLSAGYLGGRYKFAIYALLAGFVVNYFTDFSFSYSTNAETYYNGHWVDLMFPTAMALLAFGVNALAPPQVRKDTDASPRDSTPAADDSSDETANKQVAA